MTFGPLGEQVCREINDGIADGHPRSRRAEAFELIVPLPICRMPAHARPPKRFPQNDVRSGHTVVIDYRFAEGSYDRLPVFTVSAQCLNCARKQVLVAASRRCPR